MVDLLDLLKKFLNNLNEKGIPVPLIKDPIKGHGSVSLTLLFISSIHVQIALLNKFAQFFKGVDVENSIQFFLICAGLYFGRNLSTKTRKKDE